MNSADKTRTGGHVGPLGVDAAAWLLGIPVEVLRGSADAPRNPDGTYDGQTLVAWARTHVKRFIATLLAGVPSASALKAIPPQQAIEDLPKRPQRRAH